MLAGGTPRQDWPAIGLPASAEARRTDRPAARTRIQREKQDIILEAALDVFSLHGFRGATIDQIAEAAGMSKPNLLYYFRQQGRRSTRR